MELIRSQYTLEPYGSDLELLKKCQKKLFPKQVEELKAIAEKAQRSFQGKVRELHGKVDYIDVLQRHKDYFKARHSGDVTKEMATLEAIGEPLNLTQERVRQILNGTWKQLDSILEPTDFRNSDEYVQEFEKVRFMIELLTR